MYAGNYNGIRVMNVQGGVHPDSQYQNPPRRSHSRHAQGQSYHSPPPPGNVYPPHPSMQGMRVQMQAPGVTSLHSFVDSSTHDNSVTHYGDTINTTTVNSSGQVNRIGNITNVNFGTNYGTISQSNDTTTGIHDTPQSWRNQGPVYEPSPNNQWDAGARYDYDDRRYDHNGHEYIPSRGYNGVRQSGQPYGQVNSQFVQQVNVRHTSVRESKNPFHSYIASEQLPPSSATSATPAHAGTPPRSNRTRPSTPPSDFWEDQDLIAGYSHDNLKAALNYAHDPVLHQPSPAPQSTHSRGKNNHPKRTQAGKRESAQESSMKKPTGKKKRAKSPTPPPESDSGSGSEPEDDSESDHSPAASPRILIQRESPAPTDADHDIEAAEEVARHDDEAKRKTTSPKAGVAQRTTETASSGQSDASIPNGSGNQGNAEPSSSAKIHVATQNRASVSDTYASGHPECSTQEHRKPKKVSLDEPRPSTVGCDEGTSKGRHKTTGGVKTTKDKNKPTRSIQEVLAVFLSESDPESDPEASSSSAPPPTSPEQRPTDQRKSRQPEAAAVPIAVPTSVPFLALIPSSPDGSDVQSNQQNQGESKVKHPKGWVSLVK
ncbi:hypothetical protein NMY22_g17434 [Coprinellus aureogranulatus]|nr:hypothetical protein NMY22_g17434 [Coprinellus aureogranulatus]